ncbi:MAG TPA: IS1595 family transposase [Terriglobales bacterium]|nr:IS1595 family transposase [Terriglobales bacterium]
MKQVRSAVDLLSVVNRYGTDGQCREYLTQLRWPEGVKCPKCDSDKISRIKLRHQFDCDSCRYQFSVLSGTMFHDTHLALTKWFYATYILCESRKGVSANQLKRMLRVSYETAWYLCHRIRAAMKAAQPQPLLAGVVEMDETYIGGHHHGACLTGGGAPMKQIVLGIRQRGGELRFFTAHDVKLGTIRQFIKENISDKVDAFITDDFSTYQFAVKGRPLERKHKTVNHSRKEYVRGDVYTNTVESAFSLLKRGIVGTWHKISAKHLQAYLDEMSFRFDNRNNPYLFRDTLAKMLEAEHVEYKQLTAEAA